MNKKSMAEVILQNSSCIGISESKFYKNVNRQTKNWVENSYNLIINSKDEFEKKLNADLAMRFLK